MVHATFLLRVFLNTNIDLYKTSDGGSHESPRDVLARCSREPIRPSLLGLGRTRHSLIAARRYSHTQWAASPTLPGMATRTTMRRLMPRLVSPASFSQPPRRSLLLPRPRLMLPRQLPPLDPLPSLLMTLSKLWTHYASSFLTSPNSKLGQGPRRRQIDTA